MNVLKESSMIPKWKNKEKNALKDSKIPHEEAK